MIVGCWWGKSRCEIIVHIGKKTTKKHLSWDMAGTISVHPTIEDDFFQFIMKHNLSLVTKFFSYNRVNFIIWEQRKTIILSLGYQRNHLNRPYIHARKSGAIKQSVLNKCSLITQYAGVIKIRVKFIVWPCRPPYEEKCAVHKTVRNAEFRDKCGHYPSLKSMAIQERGILHFGGREFG